MRTAIIRVLMALLLLAFLFVLLEAGAPRARASPVRIPILVYHRFGARVTDSMTVRTSVFAGQLRFLKEHHITVTPLRDVVRYYLGQAGPPPPNSAVITADDGHRSIFTDMRPLVMQYKIPVTLFIYPSAISNASYAMTWSQLAELKGTGLFDIQSHTFWHPNFHIERSKRTLADYEHFVRWQFIASRERLEQKLGAKVDMLAWPFGIYDDQLIALARQCGYIAGFTIERRPATRRDNIMALPRYIVTDATRGRAFARIVETAPPENNSDDQNIR